jgi:hypothetical protein
VEEEKEQEVPIPIKEGGANLSQTLDNPNPPKLDNKKVGYVSRGINKRNASNNKTQVLKKKGRFWERNPKNVDVQVAREWDVNEELTNHEQEDLLKDEDVFASINTSVVNTSITSSFGPNVVVLDENDNKNANEELSNSF